MDIILSIKEDLDNKPKPDIAICSKCRGRYPISMCEVDPYGDGDWESGYNPIHLCPNCEDGGLIEEYDMSPRQLEMWYKWRENKKKIKIINIL